MTARVAVVGIACRYPGAEGPRALWEGILARRREFRQVPSCRLPLDSYHDPDPSVPDKTYGGRAAVLDGFQFDWGGMRIPKTTFEAMDIAHWLALDVASRAIADAGYTRETIPRERTGVVLGNTLTGEQTRAAAMRTRWPFIERVLRAAAEASEIPGTRASELARVMEGAFKSVFPPVTEDTLAGGLSNTIAGRICNHFDLHGGGYTVDGACASSLLAVCTAASQLADGTLDVALAGGVDVSLDTFELIGFAKTGALSPDEMRVYDRRANGFIPGEGCGFVVLKRLDDALAAGDEVYAVIRGWGVSSDGKGGLTAPSRDGQATALRRAYAQAGYSMNDIAFIEGHGTGTRLGDRVELEALATALGDEGEADARRRRIGVTSLKSIIGHTKAAAGIGAFLKAVMAVNRRVSPPTAGCDEPSAVFEGAARRLHPILVGRVHDETETLRAGVSAMGFGGINTHVTLESGPVASARLKPQLGECALLASSQDAEVFPISAPTVAALIERLEGHAVIAEGLGLGELADFASHLTRDLKGEHGVRCALVEANPERLAKRMRELADTLRGAAPRDGDVIATASRNAWVSVQPRRARVGFLFPGQGSQQLGAGQRVARRFPAARAILIEAARIARAGGVSGTELIDPVLDGMDEQELARARQDLARTELAQPAICAASAVYVRRLAELGIRPDVVAGHSLGELTAFHVAGAYDQTTLFQLAATRGMAMTAPPGRAGTMSSLTCDRQRAESLVARADGYAVIANVNGPSQVVVSGERDAIDRIEALAREADIAVRRLPVSNAFHSRLVADAATRVAAVQFATPRLGEPSVTLMSTVTTERVPAGTLLAEYFSAQITLPVDFLGLVRRMRTECDLFLEVGPGRVLSGLAADVCGPEGPVCLPVAGRADSDKDLMTAVAAAFCHGVNVNWDALYDERLIRPFVPPSERVFIESLCERQLALPAPRLAVDADVMATTLAGSVGVAPERLEEYLRRRHQFLAAVIRADLSHSEPVEGSARRLDPGDAQAAPRGDHALAAAPRKETEGHTRSTVELLIDLAIAQTGFSRSQITADARLLEDMNLDSIKAGALIAAAGRERGIAGEIDPIEYANARIGDIAAAIDAKQRMASGAETLAGPALAGPAWVREFVIDWKPDPVEPTDGETDDASRVDFSGARAVILHDPEDADVASALGETLEARGVRCRRETWEGLGAQDFTVVVALMPRTRSSDEPAHRVRRLATRLGVIARYCASATSTAERTGEKAAAIFLQFGGGEPEASSLAGFAATIHLERPALRVRVIDTAQGAPASLLARQLLAELAGETGFRAVGYDAGGTRRTQQARVQSTARTPRAVSLSQHDVVLVTGGGKGITAACALELGKRTRSRFALVGRSPAADPEVMRTLDDFRREGLEVHYHACDLTSLPDLERAVASIRSELGPITAVVHGAGLNKPRRTEDVAIDAALAEVGPKLLGAFHLAEVFDAAPPKLFVALTSIIGVTGMPGNAYYAWANAAVDRALRDFRDRHPSAATLSIAYGLWDAIGIGARLGSVTLLGRRGIRALSPAEGARRFVDLVTSETDDHQVIVAAEFSGLTTWPGPDVPPPSIVGRFVDETVRYIANVEWVGRTRLSLGRDPYLAHHRYRGSCLFPTVFGLEAMAQAAACVLGHPVDLARVVDVRLERPIVVPDEGELTIEIRAIRHENGDGQASDVVRVGVGIRVESTGFAIDHFAATLELGGSASTEPGEKIETGSLPALDLVPERDLYGRLLFQGPLFQRMRAVHTLDSRSVVMTVEPHPNKELADLAFSGEGRGPLVFGDPFVRDVLLQSVQLTIPRYTCLPVRIGAIEVFGRASSASHARIVRTSLLEREGSDFIAEVLCYDAETGFLCERLTGYRMRILQESDEEPSAEEIAAPGERDERVLRDAARRALGARAPAIGLAHTPGVHALPSTARRALAVPLAQRTFRDWSTTPTAIELAWEPSGKPILSGNDAFISFSHDDSYTVCAVGHDRQGIDVVPVTQRSDWASLVGKERQALLAELARQGVGTDEAGARVWAAREAVVKALGHADIGMSIHRRPDLGEVVIFEARGKEATPVAVATLKLRLTRGPDRILAIVVEPEAKVSTTTAPNPTAAMAMTTHEVAGRFEQRRRFVVSFEEANSLSHRASLSRVVRWVGRVRELAFDPVAPLLVERVRHGTHGLVTNNTRVTLSGAVTALDVLESRAYLERFEDPVGVFVVEFHKVLADGETIQVGSARQKFTWVRIVDHGRVVAEPMPRELAAFFQSLRPAGSGGSASIAPIARDLRSPGRVVASDLAHKLTAHTFETTLEDGNFIGNVYWANYFAWPAVVLDRFVHAVVPDCMRPGAPHGELVCSAMSVDHVREAMPFDRVNVSLTVRSVHERAASLEVHYFREGRSGDHARLAAGHIDVAWIGQNATLTWPDRVLTALVGAEPQREVS